MAEKLLNISDKYNVMDLKSICEDFIYSKITNENSIKTLIIADKYNAKKLQFRAIEYITNNMNDIRNASIDEWLQFIKVNHQLSDKIFESIGNQNLIRDANNLEKSIVKSSYIYHKF